MPNLLYNLILKASSGALFLVLHVIIIILQGVLSSSMWVYKKCVDYIEVTRRIATRRSFKELKEEAKEVYQSYARG